MANLRKFLRSTTEAAAAFTQPSGVGVIDMITKLWRTHDGVTPGGFLVGGRIGVGGRGDGVTDDSTAVRAAALTGLTVEVTKPHRVSGVLSLGRVAFGPNGRLIAAAGAIVTIAEIEDTRAQIFDDSAGATFRVTQKWVRPDWFGDVFDSVLKAVAALPTAGGTVKIGNRRYKPNNTDSLTKYMAKASIFFDGEQMPTYAYNCDRLVGGSIIEGRFNVWAEDFSHRNVGYDLGKFVCDTYYHGLDTHTANHPNGPDGDAATWDAFAFAKPGSSSAIGAVSGYRAENVRGLLRDGQSFGHSILQEGFDGGYINNVVGVGGVHAHVIKASNVQAGSIGGYGASTDHVIVKSDTYALGRNITVADCDADLAPPKTAPWWNPAKAQYGLFLHPALANLTEVHFGRVRIGGALQPLFSTGDGTKFLTDVQIDSLLINGAGAEASPLGFNFNNVKWQRVQIGELIINNVGSLGAISQPDINLSGETFRIGSIKAVNVTGRGLAAYDYARVRVDTYEGKNMAAAYWSDQFARILVGNEFFENVLNKFESGGATLGTGWANFGGDNAAFAMTLDGGGVRMKGLLKPTGAGTALATIPQCFSPIATERRLAYGRSGAVSKAIPVAISPAGTIDIEGDVADAATWLSLDMDWKTV